MLTYDEIMRLKNNKLEDKMISYREAVKFLGISEEAMDDCIKWGDIIPEIRMVNDVLPEMYFSKFGLLAVRKWWNLRSETRRKLERK